MKLLKQAKTLYKPNIVKHFWSSLLCPFPWGKISNMVNLNLSLWCHWVEKIAANHFFQTCTSYLQHTTSTGRRFATSALKSLLTIHKYREVCPILPMHNFLSFEICSPSSYSRPSCASSRPKPRPRISLRSSWFSMKMVEGSPDSYCK